MRASYAHRRKESFTGNLDSDLTVVRKCQCGVSILTDQKPEPKWNELFNYSGMHNLFDAVAKISLLSNAPGTLQIVEFFNDESHVHYFVSLSSRFKLDVRFFVR